MEPRTNSNSLDFEIGDYVEINPNLSIYAYCSSSKFYLMDKEYIMTLELDMRPQMDYFIFEFSTTGQHDTTLEIHLLMVMAILELMIIKSKLYVNYSENIDWDDSWIYRVDWWWN